MIHHTGIKSAAAPRSTMRASGYRRPEWLACWIPRQRTLPAVPPRPRHGRFCLPSGGSDRPAPKPPRGILGSHIWSHAVGSRCTRHRAPRQSCIEPCDACTPSSFGCPCAPCGAWLLAQRALGRAPAWLSATDVWANQRAPESCPWRRRIRPGPLLETRF